MNPMHTNDRPEEIAWDLGNMKKDVLRRSLALMDAAQEAREQGVIVEVMTHFLGSGQQR
ncbi:MAG: hypothetical protein AAFY15_12325 [Cyanobacteria bacterium J06648_11]